MGLFRKTRRLDPNVASDAAAVSPQPQMQGPFDSAQAPHASRTDFGSLKIPDLDGLDITLDMDNATKRVSGLTLNYKQSLIQVSAYAAPKSSGLWDEIRGSLRESIAAQGGTTETREGSFGTEIHARIPVQSPHVHTRRYRPMRCIGVDGPRWFLRAVISGHALQDAETARDVETLIRSIVVERGREAMAPKEILTLSVPSSAPASQHEPTIDDMGPHAQGPTIAVTG